MKQPRPKWLVPAIVAAAIVVIIIIGVVSRHGADAIPVTTITVAPGNMVVKLPENGVVDLPQTATIAAQSAGTVVEVVAHEGQRVRGGALLMRLDDRQAAAKVAADRAQAAQAQAALDKAQQTAQIAGDTSIQTVAGAEQTLLAAQARLQGDINSKREGQLSGAVAGSSAFGVSGESQLIQQEQQLQAATSNLQTARETYVSDQALFKIDALSRQALDRGQLLRAVGPRADHDQGAEPVIFEPDVEVHPVDPDGRFWRSSHHVWWEWRLVPGRTFGRGRSASLDTQRG